MSARYNTIERTIAKALGVFPSFKPFVKKTYQGVNAMIYKKSYCFQSDYVLHTLPLDSETFFGYYDKSPESQDQKFILFHYSNYPTTSLPSDSKPINLGLWNINEERIAYTKEIRAYNWQQGAKLQWLGEKKFIFNNYENSIGYHSVLVTINGDTFEESIFPMPIYDCFRSDFALTLNFKRLQKLRPDYGYRNEEIDELLPYHKDGIFHLDLISGKTSLLIKMQDLLKIGSKPEMEDAEHKVNHIMISPDGEHFVFLHRYFYKGRRFDRLFVSDISGNELSLLADEEMVSHYQWKDSLTLVAYLRDKSFGDKYYEIDVYNRSIKRFGDGILDSFGDGHPTIKGKFMVFDTYPNKSRMKELYLYNQQNNKLSKLGEFHESLQYYGETRCDLHPRFNEKGNRIYFDSVHDGKRNLYWITLY